VTILSAIVAVVLYWGHFGDVYKNALHVRGNAGASAAQVGTSPTPNGAPPQNTVVTRIRDAITFGVGVIGWPIILLALVGCWRSVVDGGRDRASLAALAWGVACVVFLGVAVMRVDAPFQRYAAEFFGRVLLATFPAAVVLAARGTGWAWRHGATTRFASLILVICAVILGVQSWTAWFL